MKNISINEILYQYEQCVNEKEHINSMSFKSSDELKNKYGISIYRLVNIAIYNALNS